MMPASESMPVYKRSNVSNGEILDIFGWRTECEEIADAFPKQVAMQAVADRHFNLCGFTFAAVRARYYRWRNAGGDPAALLDAGDAAQNLHGLTPEMVTAWFAAQDITLAEWARRRGFCRGNVHRAFHQWCSGPTDQATLDALACDMAGGPGNGLAEREERARIAVEPPPPPNPVKKRKIKHYERLTLAQRAEIQAAPAHVSTRELAARYGTSDVTIHRWRKRDFTADRNSEYRPRAKWRPGTRKFTEADVALVVETRRKTGWSYARIADELRGQLSTPMSAARVHYLVAADNLAGEIRTSATT